MDSRNQRRSVREVKVKWKSAEVQFEAVTRDISPSGAFVVTNQVEPVRSVIEVELSMGQSRPAVRCFGKVIWVNNGQVETFPPGFGIEFLELGDRSRGELARFCSDIDLP
jgi:Tfp pilus assembly protein PilZ